MRALGRRLLPKSARRWLRHEHRRGVATYKRLTRKLLDTSTPYRNREGFRNFDFVLRGQRDRAGASAIVRVRNEERKLRYVLASIYDVFDEIVLVDNGSEDESLKIVREFKAQRDPGDKIKVYLYPFRIARNGQESITTPEDSVHSQTYYLNWCLAHCSFRYVCKWDADMVLKREAREAILRLLHRVQDVEVCWELPGQTLYRDLSGKFYLSKGEINQEIRIFPYGNPRFVKWTTFAVLEPRPPLPVESLDDVAFYELKFLDEDEFAHWCTTDFPTERKRREWECFHMLKRGEVPRSRFEALSASFLREEVGLDPRRDSDVTRLTTE